MNSRIYNMFKLPMLGISAMICLAASLSASAAPAAKPVPEVKISDASLTRQGDQMTVNFKIGYDKLKMKSAGAVVLVPMIVNQADTLRLPSLGIYGRTAWYAARRNYRLPLTGDNETAVRFQKGMPSTDYKQTVRYESWMNGSDLILEIKDFGCMGCNEGNADLDLAHYELIKVDYQPVFIYQTAVAERAKTRELAGRAFIDFPVNRVEINPDYRRNASELRKIIATIDSVKNDKDVTVTSISIKGFASPEGAYASNARLAQGRTESLRNYVQSLYHFAPGFIRTSFEPEDWQGLKEYVEGSSLPDKYEILAIINDRMMDPDVKDATIKKRFPSTYSYLLQNVYPALRHSDYRIEYEIRSFADPVEIRRLLVTEPGKLSLNEIYIAAQGLQPGSEQYNEIFETAARLYPNEPVANLNAANAMMQRGDLVGAARYLDKAGNSAEAVYARGVLSALNGQYESAIAQIQQAMTMGAKVDAGVIDHLNEVIKYSGQE